MRHIRKFLIVTLAEIILIATLHFVLLWWCAEGDVVSKALFSPGKHTARADLYVTGGFLLVRLVAVLLLPGIVLERAGRLLLIWREDRRAYGLEGETSGNAETEPLNPDS
ncbi:hypothetical protein ACFL01_03025 [Planctomycetota bacterium]